MVDIRVETIEKLNMESLYWGGFTWINIEKPTEEVKDYLAQHFPFHALDLDDCLSRIQRSKIDEYRDYLFIVLHFPLYNKQARVTVSSQVSVFIGENYLITLHEGRLKPLTKLFFEVRSEEKSKETYMGNGPAYLLYRIIDRLVDYCFPIINKVGGNIESIEDRIFTESKRATVKEISGLRRDIISLRRTVSPMRTTISTLEPKIRRFGQTDLTVYFGDTVDHLDRVWDALEEYKEVIEGLNSAYDSLASEKMNEILRVLTILATIGTVLTVIVGYFGMNIPLPGGSNPGGFTLSWIILLIVMISIISVMLFYFKRKNWL